MPVITRGGRGKEGAYDAVACLAWWRDHQGNINAKEKAQARAFDAAAELNELKLQQARGELVPRDQVILEGQSYTKGWTAKVRALPRRLTQAGVITRDREHAAAGLCRQLLEEIAAWRTVADVARAVKRAGRSRAA